LSLDFKVENFIYVGPDGLFKQPIHGISANLSVAVRRGDELCTSFVLFSISQYSIRHHRKRQDGFNLVEYAILPFCLPLHLFLNVEVNVLVDLRGVKLAGIGT